MPKSTTPVAVLLAVIVLLPTAAQDGSSPASFTSEEPRNVGLTESTEQRLLQLDVSVHGPADRVHALTSDDFELVIAGRVIDDVIVDRVCTDQVLRAREQVATDDAPRGNVPAAGFTLLIYLDEFHLTHAGRHEALRTAREFVRNELHAPDRAMVVSGARYVRIYSDLTSDRDVLLAAIDEMEADASQVEGYASLEERRVEEVYQALEDATKMKRLDDEDPFKQGTSPGAFSGSGGVGTTLESGAARTDRAGLRPAGPPQANPHQMIQAYATVVAREKQKEERAVTEGALERLALALERIAYAQPPKAVLYFADRMRSNPGDHYWDLLNIDWGHGDGGKYFLQVEHGADSNAFDALIDAAAARGVRFYTVQAEGLTAPAPMSPSGAGEMSAARSPISSRNRFQDAKGALMGLARETGGAAFLHGGGTARAIAARLEEDLDCIYLLSFHPGDLPQDRALQVLVNLRPRDLKARYRSRVWAGDVGHDPTDELRAALATSRLADDVGELRLGVIPTGFNNGVFSALIQTAVAPAADGIAHWEIGLTASQRGTPRGEWSRTVQTNQPGVPVIFEGIGEFKQGDFEITAIARELRTGQIVSARYQGEWPDPRAVDPTLGPLAVVQPVVGAFARDETTRTHGSLIVGRRDWLQPDQPTALIGIACRGAASNRDLVIRRALSGTERATFDDVALAGSDDRCHLFVDQIQAGTLTSGFFDFEAAVVEKERTVASVTAEIVVVSAEDVPLGGRP